MNIKTEKTDEVKKEDGEEGKMEEKNKEAVMPEMGRLVMTIDGQQKLLPFGPNDLLSTATMLDGDKVRAIRQVHHLTDVTRTHLT